MLDPYQLYSYQFLAGVVAIKPVLLIVLLTIGLRFTGLTFDSLWLDEGYQTVVESYGNDLPNFFDPKTGPYLFNPGQPASLPVVLSKFRRVDPLCPPLFAAIMNRWLTVFGGSDFSLRSLSAVSSIISVLAILCLGSALFGRRVGTMASLLQAISPFDIAYGQEARMYSLVVLTAVLSGGAFILLCTRRPQFKSLFFAAIYIIATWAMVNTHYTGLFVWAFEIAAGFALAFWRRDWLLFFWLLSGNLLITGLCLPWLPMFEQAAAIRTESFYVSRPPTWWWPIWALCVRIPFNWIFFLAGKRVMSYALPIYFLSAAINLCGFQIMLPRALRWLCLNNPWQNLGPILGQNLAKENGVGIPTDAFSDQKNCASLLLVLWCLVPALAIWLVDVIEGHRVIEISRYVIGTAPAIFLIAAVGVAHILRHWRFGFWLITIYGVFALANNAYAHVVYQREDWRGAAKIVSAVCQNNEVLLVSQYYDIVCLDRYLERPLRQIGIGPAMGNDKIAHLLQQEIQPHPESFWLLTAQDGDGVLTMMPLEFAVVQKYELGHALHLRHYAKKP